MKSTVVVGGGIGGLATGIALKEAGLEVTVLERSSQVSELGAGLSIWPNGVRALRALGLGSKIASAPRASGALRRADGSVLADFEPTALEERYGAPLLGLHRADLLDALHQELGSERVRLGAEVTSVRSGVIGLDDGSELTPDLIVGADGLHSVVRQSILHDGEPRASGLIAYRGVAAESGATPAGECWGRESVAGLLPLGGGQVYWYLACRGDGSPNELEGRAAEYGSPVVDAIRRTDEAAVLVHPLFDRAPSRALTHGNVVLVGDAAHPMLPFLGQGACCALEDAVALGRAVGKAVDAEGAAKLYEHDRAGRAALLIRRSRSAARVALLKSTSARSLRNFAVQRLPEGIRLRQLDGVLGTSATEIQDN